MTAVQRAIDLLYAPLPGEPHHWVVSEDVLLRLGAEAQYPWIEFRPSLRMLDLPVVKAAGNGVLLLVRADPPPPDVRGDC